MGTWRRLASRSRAALFAAGALTLLDACETNKTRRAEQGSIPSAASSIAASAPGGSSASRHPEPTPSAGLPDAKRGVPWGELRVACDADHGRLTLYDSDVAEQPEDTPRPCAGRFEERGRWARHSTWRWPLRLRAWWTFVAGQAGYLRSHALWLLRWRSRTLDQRVEGQSQGAVRAILWRSLR